MQRRKQHSLKTPTLITTGILSPIDLTRLPAFFQMVPAPATNPDWLSAAVMAGLGALGAATGGLLLHRRDLIMLDWPAPAQLEKTETARSTMDR